MQLCTDMCFPILKPGPAWALTPAHAPCAVRPPRAVPTPAGPHAPRKPKHRGCAPPGAVRGVCITRNRVSAGKVPPRRERPAPEPPAPSPRPGQPRQVHQPINNNN